MSQDAIVRHTLVTSDAKPILLLASNEEVALYRTVRVYELDSAAETWVPDTDKQFRGTLKTSNYLSAWLRRLTVAAMAAEGDRSEQMFDDEESVVSWLRAMQKA